MASHTGRLLARAFHDDPMFVHVQPDAERRRRALPWLFTASARLGRQHGRVDATGLGAAVWLAPGRTGLGRSAIVRSGLWAAPARLGPAAFRRLDAVTDALVEAGRRAHGDSYWHLFMLGIDPPAQGHGHGSALLGPALDDADRAGQECYLETFAQSNLAFYTRHRFETVERVDLPGLPPFWTMLRRPR